MDNKDLKMFQIENSQTGYPDGEPITARSLEEAQATVLAWNGVVIREVK